MDAKQKLKEMIKQMLGEMTATGNVAGYDTPFAFSRKSLTPKLTKRTKKIPNQKKHGYKTIPQGDPNGPSSKLLRNEAVTVHAFKATKESSCRHCKRKIKSGSKAYFCQIVMPNGGHPGPAGAATPFCSTQCAKDYEAKDYEDTPSRRTPNSIFYWASSNHRDRKKVGESTDDTVQNAYRAWQKAANPSEKTMKRNSNVSDFNRQQERIRKLKKRYDDLNAARKTNLQKNADFVKNEEALGLSDNAQRKAGDVWHTSLFHVAMNQSGDVRYFDKNDRGLESAKKYAGAKERHASSDNPDPIAGPGGVVGTGRRKPPRTTARNRERRNISKRP